MLSPKMQRCVRVNDTQLLMLAERAQYDHSMVMKCLSGFEIMNVWLSLQHGQLHKRNSDNQKWQTRWFILYQVFEAAFKVCYICCSNLFVPLQNLLFYYDCESAVRPSGLIFLEGSYCERTNCSPSLLQQQPNNARIAGKEEKQVTKVANCDNDVC